MKLSFSFKVFFSLAFFLSSLLAHAQSHVDVKGRIFMTLENTGEILELLPTKPIEQVRFVDAPFLAVRVFNYQEELWAYSTDQKLYKYRINKWQLQGSNVADFVNTGDYLLAYSEWDHTVWVYRGDLKGAVWRNGKIYIERNPNQFEKLPYEFNNSRVHGFKVSKECAYGLAFIVKKSPYSSHKYIHCVDLPNLDSRLIFSKMPRT